MGIRHVGETVARTLASRFSSLDELIEADELTLTGVREIGPRIATSIRAYFSDPENMDIIRRLRQKGIQFSEESGSLQVSAALEGMTVVISGVFSRHSREEYKEIIEKHGGKNSSSISAKTTFILAGENMGPSKREKAAELGVRIMDESEFLKIIGEE